MSLPTAELTSAWATIDGLRIHTRCSAAPVAGRLPIVLVHGLSVSSRYMVPVARRLAFEYPVFAPDLPGFGKSEHPKRVLSIPELAGALASWMDAFGIGRAALLGNSMGCQVIAELALRWPARAARLIFTGPTIDRHARTMPAQAARLAADILHEPISSIATQARDYWACGLRRTVGTLRHALADRVEHKLPLLGMPALVVRGTDDTIAPQPWVDEFTRLLPRGRLVVLASPHAVNYDAPDALARAVLAFLAAGAE